MVRIRISGIAASVAIVSILSCSMATAAGTTNCKIHKGDTLWSLAAKHGTTVQKILQLNNLSEKSILRPGKTIIIPSKISPAALNRSGRVSNESRQASSIIHTRVDNVCLRSEPDSDSQKLDVLSADTTCTLLEKDGHWAKVQLSDGTTGYINRQLLASGAGDSDAANKSDEDSSESADCPALINTALACRGARYVRGGVGRGGFDCSGFTRYVYAKYGVSLPHSSAAQASHGKSVSRDELVAGDLVFFQTNGRGISHVGIYIGDNNFVHAASRGRGVRTDSLNSAYYSPRYRGARRVK